MQRNCEAFVSEKSLERQQGLTGVDFLSITATPSLDESIFMTHTNTHHTKAAGLCRSREDKLTAKVDHVKTN